MIAKNRSPIRVLIVDERALMRAGLAAVISEQADMEVTAETGNLAEALTLSHHHRPDIALVELASFIAGGPMSDALCRQSPRCRIIVIANRNDEENIERARRAGAIAYLSPEITGAELLRAIRAAHAGRPSLAPAVAPCRAERARAAALTRRELEILRLLAQGQSNREIAAALYISESTVKGHINNILAKCMSRTAPKRSSRLCGAA